MIEIDARVPIVLGVIAGIATLAAPAAVGSWVLAAGAVAAILTTRSVLRTEESDVTTAIVAGGGVVLIGLAPHGDGHVAPRSAICAGVFAGAEIAALGRRLGVDHDAPAGARGEDRPPPPS